MTARCKTTDPQPDGHKIAAETPDGQKVATAVSFVKEKSHTSRQEAHRQLIRCNRATSKLKVHQEAIGIVA